MQKPCKVKLELYDAVMLDTRVNYVALDKETMPVYIQLLAHKKPVKLSENVIVELNFQNLKGTRFPRIAEVLDYEKAEILYEIDAADIAVPGIVTVSVTVTQGNERLTWRGFSFNVLQNQSDDQSEPPDVLVPWKDAITGQLSGLDGRVSFLEEFGGGSGSGEGSGGTSDLLWKPTVAGNGDITWVRSVSTTPPATQNIKGTAGYTPVRGTDYWTSADIAAIQGYIDIQVGGALSGSY